VLSRVAHRFSCLRAANVLLVIQERVKSGLFAKPRYYDWLKRNPPVNHLNAPHPRYTVVPEEHLFQVRAAAGAVCP
jgi:hypothetical protein